MIMLVRPTFILQVMLLAYFESQAQESNHCTELWGAGEPIANYGEECGSASTQPKCRGYSFLECRNGHCECAIEKSWYDSHSGKCLLIAGSVCSGKEQLCIRQAYCSLNTGRCVCLKGLKQNKQRLCTLDYGAECWNQPDGWICDGAKFLTCDSTEGKCVCYNSNNTLMEDGTCKLKANAKCVQDSNFALQCIGGAFCSKKSENRSICECSEPLQATTAGLCEHKPNSSVVEEEKSCTRGAGHRHNHFGGTFCFILQSLFFYYIKFYWC